MDQTVLFTQNIEDLFEAKKKAGAVFVDLTAAYDTVWHRDLTCKLFRLLPVKHMIRIIMKLFRNRSFTLTTGDSKQSRLRSFRNGLPPGSILALLLFNIYTYDLPSALLVVGLPVTQDWFEVGCHLSPNLIPIRLTACRTSIPRKRRGKQNKQSAFHDFSEVCEC